MGDSDSDYVQEEEEKEQGLIQTQTPVKKSKIHAHCRESTDVVTGKKKLNCNYCPNSYSYKGGNTSSMMQHLRVCHRDVPDVVCDIPDTPGNKPSKAQEKRTIAQSSIIEGLDLMCPMHPDNRVAIKIRDCLSLLFMRDIVGGTAQNDSDTDLNL